MGRSSQIRVERRNGPLRRSKVRTLRIVLRERVKRKEKMRGPRRSYPKVRRVCVMIVLVILNIAIFPKKEQITSKSYCYSVTRSYTILARELPVAKFLGSTLAHITILRERSHVGNPDLQTIGCKDPARPGHDPSPSPSPARGVGTGTAGRTVGLAFPSFVSA